MQVVEPIVRPPYELVLILTLTLTLILIRIIIIIVKQTTTTNDNNTNNINNNRVLAPALRPLVEERDAEQHLVVAGPGGALGHALLHPVSITRFPSFRTQPLENLSHYL